LSTLFELIEAGDVEGIRAALADDPAAAAAHDEDGVTAIMRAAYRGKDVLDAVCDFSPDVVLLDIGMPQMTGYDVARTLRERYGSARPALIAVTGRAAESDKPEARAAGFEHHVAKPYEPRALLQLIGQLAAR